MLLLLARLVIDEDDVAVSAVDVVDINKQSVA